MPLSSKSVIGLTTSLLSDICWSVTRYYQSQQTLFLFGVALARIKKKDVGLTLPQNATCSACAGSSGENMGHKENQQCQNNVDRN